LYLRLCDACNCKPIAVLRKNLPGLFVEVEVEDRLLFLKSLPYYGERRDGIFDLPTHVEVKELVFKNTFLRHVQMLAVRVRFATHGVDADTSIQMKTR
jgi:hypothetical protein